MIICLSNVRKATIFVEENGDHHLWHLVSPYFLFADRAGWDIKSVEAAELNRVLPLRSIVFGVYVDFHVSFDVSYMFSWIFFGDTDDCWSS